MKSEVELEDLTQKKKKWRTVFKTLLQIQWLMEHDEVAVVYQISKVQHNVWMLISGSLTKGQIIQNHESHGGAVLCKIISIVNMIQSAQWLRHYTKAKVLDFHGKISNTSNYKGRIITQCCPCRFRAFRNFRCNCSRTCGSFWWWKWNKNIKISYRQ